MICMIFPFMVPVAIALMGGLIGFGFWNYNRRGII
jgi:hypothetical protein